jgi:putative sigma-54 modulation protein
MDATAPPMNSHSSHKTDSPKLIISGIHLWITDAMKATLRTKAERLFRHEPRILRLRIDVEHDLHGRLRVFTAKGRVEIAGPDLSAAVTAADAYVAINRLIARLDRMLRKRTSALLRRRSTGDIRAHAGRLAFA